MTQPTPPPDAEVALPDPPAPPVVNPLEVRARLFAKALRRMQADLGVQLDVRGLVVITDTTGASTTKYALTHNDDGLLTFGPHAGP